MTNYSNSIEMLALGRQFRLGTLYDYINDSIVPNMRLWDPDDVDELIDVNTEVTTEVLLKATEQTDETDNNFDEEEDHVPFLSYLGMDNHTAMSLMTGLSRPPLNGAWQYAADWAESKEELFNHGAHVAVYCCYSGKKVSVDPEIHQLEIVCRRNKLTESQATHVVVAISYGREAFCIFPKDKAGTQDNPRTSDDVIVEKTRNYARIFKNRLMDGSKNLEPDEEEESDDEEGVLCPIPKDLQCILYSDLTDGRGGRSWTLRPVTEQYESCRKILEHRDEKDIPLKVWLYPLYKLMEDEETFAGSRKYRKDVSQELISRCQFMLSRFHGIRLEADVLTNEVGEHVHHYIWSAFCGRIKHFTELVTKFLVILPKVLAKWTVEIRHGTNKQETMAKFIDSIETHSPFAAQKLKRLQSLHKLEFKTLKSLDKLSGVLLVSNREHLENEIKNGGNGSRTVVLHLPSPREESDSLIDEMSRYVDNVTEAASSTRWETSVTASSNQTAEPAPSTFRQIFTASQEFSDWVTNYNFDVKNVRYIIFYEECTGTKLPFTRLYQCGREQQAPPLDFTIPKVPGQVTVEKNHRGVIVLSWSTDDTTGQSNYLVQYRSIGGQEENWKSIQNPSKTIKLSYFQSGETYLFRVAEDTLGGRSPFSPVSCPVTIDPVCPSPTGLCVEDVTDTSISLSWHEQSYFENDNDGELTMSSYSIGCWIGDSCHDSTLIQRSTRKTSIVLEPLAPGMIYQVQVRVECKDASGSTFYSPASKTLEISTLGEAERTAHIVRRFSQKCTHRNEIDVYQLLLRNQRDTRIQGVGRFVFGQPSYLAVVGERRRRTILVLGATGSGKSTLINAMVNYALGIEWEDDFRFKLIDESVNRSQARSQTDSVTTYDLYEMKGSRLGYSLTIVDTPGFGDTSGIEKDKKIMKQIRDYFQCPHGIQQLEAVCFVVQSSLARLTETQQYIFDQVLSIFGQNIKDNIRVMVTFADSGSPPVLDAIKEAKIPSPIDSTTGLLLHHKFNNSIFFTTNKGDRQTNEFNRTSFQMAVKGFDKFFDDLSRMEAKSLSLTREVLEERKRLESLVEGLQLRTQMKLAQVDEFEQIKKKLNENCQQMDANKNFEFEVEFLVPQETDISGTGKFTTNCQKCTITCHFPCTQASDADKHRCSMMDPSGHCRICKCPSTDHFNHKYRYEMVKKKVQRSSDAIWKQYQGANTERLTNEQLLAKIQTEIDKYEKQLMELMEATSPCIQRLNEIALKPYALSTPAYIDLMIANEKQEHREGYQQRISTLERLRQVSELTTKLIGDQQRTGGNPTEQPVTPSIFFKNFFSSKLKS